MIRLENTSRVSTSQLFSLACPWLFTRRVGNRCEAREFCSLDKCLTRITYYSRSRTEPAIRNNLQADAI